MQLNVQSELLSARQRFLARLVETEVFSISASGTPSVADSSSVPSKAIALHMMEAIGVQRGGNKLDGQVAGALFETLVGDFVEDVFPRLASVRCGNFRVGRKEKVSNFDQYEHLAEIVRLASERREIKIAFGMDYIIQPDVVIAREVENENTITDPGTRVDADEAKHTPLFNRPGVKPTLHASVSCKLTLRSDRAQNARSEALNLIRNRKGKLPHIVIVTAEPTAARISSLALGTGDIDCVYHAALPELMRATEALVAAASKRAKTNSEKSLELLNTLVDGRRLRDIADLPFDLAI